MAAVEGNDTSEGDGAASWVAGASEARRDAHFRAQRWSHVLSWQIDRLYDARRRARESYDRVLQASHYPDEARWPFMETDAEAHFALVAARQLIRALRAFDGEDRLPKGLSNALVRDVRDAFEHWDTPGGSEAANRLRRLGADPSSHRWTRDGPGVLGDVLLDAVLRQWAVEVYAELARWDPYDGWRP